MTLLPAGVMGGSSERGMLKKATIPISTNRKITALEK
jgi:hypothetical protein